MLVDLYMSQVSGLEILQATLEAYKDTIVVVMTGNPSVTSSIEALRAGAWDYLPKPFSATHLQVLIGRASHAVMMSREAQDLRVQLMKQVGHSDKIALIGISPLVPQGGGPGPQGCRDRRVGVHQRRERYRQGSHRPVHPPAQPARQPDAGADQLRRAARAAARVGDVRSPEGRVHRRRPGQAGPARDGERRARSSSTS